MPCNDRLAIERLFHNIHTSAWFYFILTGHIRMSESQGLPLYIVLRAFVPGTATLNETATDGPHEILHLQGSLHQLLQICLMQIQAAISQTQIQNEEGDFGGRARKKKIQTYLGGQYSNGSQICWRGIEWIDLAQGRDNDSNEATWDCSRSCAVSSLGCGAANLNLLSEHLLVLRASKTEPPKYDV